MNNKILIEIEIPSIEKRYDVFIPINKKVGTIKRLLEGGSLEFFLSSIATLTGGSGAVGIIVTDGSFGEQRRKLDCAIIKSASQFNRLDRKSVV